MDMNRQGNGQTSDRAGVGGLRPVQDSKPYDASRDPRTGRPPSPLEAQRLAREHEIEKVKAAQTPDEVTEAYQDDASADLQKGDITDTRTEEIEDTETGSLAEEQAPGRMKSPDITEEEKTAANALVQEGVSRERAEQLVYEHGTDWESLKAAAWPENIEDSDVATEESRCKSVLREHHEEGIPPFETPGIKE